MNMNMNLNLSLDPKVILPILRKIQPYVFGALLVGVFAYTAYVVNASLNVQADEATQAATSDTATKITFDKNTIEALKNLSGVSGEVPVTNLGSSDPFR